MDQLKRERDERPADRTTGSKPSVWVLCVFSGDSWAQWTQNQTVERVSITQRITNTRRSEGEYVFERVRTAWLLSSQREVLLLLAGRFRGKNRIVARRMAVPQWNWTETQQRNRKGEIQGVGTELWQDAWLSSEDFSSTQKRCRWCCYKRKLVTFIINETLKTLYIHITDELKVVNPRSPGAANTSM